MKKLSDYKRTEDGAYIDDNDCQWDDLEGFLQGYILDFCLCGDPEINLSLIYDLLTFLKERSNIDDKTTGFENWLNLYRLREQFLIKYVKDNPKAFLNFFWYVMAKKNITEHGSSIPGWIDDENFYEALCLWNQEREKDLSPCNQEV